jgi:transcriptional regulator with XRE-family HTH domain
MATVYSKFGQRVRILRKQQGFTQEELAEKALIDPKSIIEIENGKRNPSLKTMHKIAKVLKTSTSELLK